jgi:hypothetical protein
MAKPEGLSDQELLNLVTSERQRSIGFDIDATLADERTTALEYYKGVMRDIPSLKNRSKAVSLDVADAIETILPDLVEIFTGGEDVAAFNPTGQEDEEAAKQETDAVNHVVFKENPGWLTFTSTFKDALQAKTGVFKWWWDEGGEDVEAFKGKTAIELQLAAKDGEIIDAQPSEEQGDEPLYDFKVRKTWDGRVRIDTVAPEDITVARDTVWLPKANYCATRSRPRVQDLIAQGIDADKLAKLPTYSDTGDDQVADARDTVDEATANTADAMQTMRQVEVVEHYIRVRDEDGDTIYQVLTGGHGEDGVLLRKQEVNAIQLSAITPFLVTHRFYGESIADKLIEIQRIKTALMRMTLDAGYFALNQRSVLNMRVCDATTVSDYLNNSPGVPIRAQGPDAVIPVNAGGLNYDPLAHLEYFSTVAEQRTGIVRNAQGLNPDTLHDTAAGAQQLMMMAQKRVRMIARTFAETGVKDLFVGVHALLREHSTKQKMVRLRNKWVPIDPSSWGVRDDMNIEVGLGASGREHDMMVMDRVAGLQAAIVQVQGGLDGPIVTAKNAYATAIRATEKAGVKNPEAFFSDPDQAQPQQPKPDPEMVKVQGQMQLEQTKAQGQMQLEQAKTQAKAQADTQAAQSDFQLSMTKLNAEMELKRYQVDQELTLKREQLQAELQLKRELGFAQASVSHQVGMAKVSASTSQVEAGGEPG